MKLTLELPLLVRGKPKTGRAVTDIFCTTTFAADVEEISLREMDIVFEVRERTVSTGRLSPAQQRPDREELWQKKFEAREPFRLRSYDGATYRRIAPSLEGAIAGGLFNTPFDDRVAGRLAESYHQQRHGWPAEYGGDITPLRLGSGNKPIARPLTDEFEWRLDRESIHGLNSKTAWPRPPARGQDYSRGWHAHRNAIRFAEAGIRDIAAEDLDLAFAMYKSQSEKLLIVDGEVWMKSRPPAYRVQYIPGIYRSSPSWIDIAMVTAPEGYVGDLLTQYFSLQDYDQATEAANKLNRDEKDWTDGFTYEFSDFRKPFECSDDSLLDYDYQQEDINRFGYTAAVECWSYLMRNPEKAERLDDQQIAMIEAAYGDVGRVNHVLGVHHDMTDYVQGLNAAWKALGYRQILTGGQGMQYHAEHAAERALRYVENAPINLNVQPTMPFDPKI